MCDKKLSCGYSQQKMVAIATSLDGSKNLLKSLVYSHSSTMPAYFVKIGPVNVEIIDFTKSLKI